MFLPFSSSCIAVHIAAVLHLKLLQRAALSSKNLTKITLQSFVAWKKRKLRERKQKAEEEEKDKKDKIKAGKAVRDLFSLPVLNICILSHCF